MATSESDDFESADEEMNHDILTKKCIQTQWNLPTTIDSESDDDTEYVPRQPHTNISFNREKEKYSSMIDTAIDKKNFDKNININDTHNYKHEQPIINVDKTCDKIDENTIILNSQKIEYPQTNIDTINLKVKNNNKTIELDKNEIDTSLKMDINMELYSEISKFNEKERIHKEQKLYKKKLGNKFIPSSNLTTNVINMNTNINEKNIPMTKENVMFDKTFITDEITESEMPEEMKSNKTFKEIFKPQGWEGLGDAIELPEELTEEKLQPVLKRLSLSEEIDNSSNWGWANWGVSSLINTATAGVSTLTSHVSQGLTLLEESMTISEEPKPITNEEKQNNTVNDDNKNDQFKEQSSFGFGNLISSVSSITKLVESTGSKVMSGGLDTLEAIGKKTMEVLQEGDPGLKKKRAFFINESDKPNLSQILREAKKKAENVEKTIEEKQKMRKVHFESLFDDYQGLVHIEALEMLSKQSNIKIQQHLNGLDINELNSVQKMLEEVEELCELGEDENNDETHEKDLKYKLKQAICDLGINITYDKLYEICQNSQVYTTQSMTYTNQEIFEHAISVLAQFTAVSVERFHKTAGLLLIKEHRSTVNETDSLVQLTNILSNQIGILANTYCNILSKLTEISDKSDNINSNITTIFMEASNASSYIQHAFKLLIPIIQVGAI